MAGQKYKRMKVEGRLIDQHRLVMENYLGRVLNRNEVVHHVNGDPSDNRIENLELMDLGSHSRMHLKGKRPVNYGSRNERAKLCEDDVLEIFRLFSNGQKGADIARQFGVNRTLISKIKLGQMWKHVDRPPLLPA